MACESVYPYIIARWRRGVWEFANRQLPDLQEQKAEKGPKKNGTVKPLTAVEKETQSAVSYTHLTLPTILLV